MKTREEFHNLIDKIEDERVLMGYLKLVQRLNSNQTGELWNDLNPEEKEELLVSYDESFYSDNLISHDEVKDQHSKWLKK